MCWCIRNIMRRLSSHIPQFHTLILCLPSLWKPFPNTFQIIHKDFLDFIVFRLLLPHCITSSPRRLFGINSWKMLLFCDETAAGKRHGGFFADLSVGFSVGCWCRGGCVGFGGTLSLAPLPTPSSPLTDPTPPRSFHYLLLNIIKIQQHPIRSFAPPGFTACFS